MYSPSLFVETRLDVLHSFVREHSLATIVTAGPDGPEASHVPVVVHPATSGNGVLRCHFPRANPHWRTLPELPVLAIFHGPDHYITPSWYPSKQEHGKVVPTWNYVVVHVHGRARILDGERELLDHLHALTDANEQRFEKPWSVNDAPREYIQAMTRNIVAIEISIDRIVGKCKVNQNRPEQDRQGVIAGLNEMNTPRSREMAELVVRGGLA